MPNLITVEDHGLAGGFGSAILEFLADEGLNDIRVKRLGVPDRFIQHGTQDELRKICGFDKDAITQATLQMLRRGKKRNREGWEGERLDKILVERRLVTSRRRAGENISRRSLGERSTRYQSRDTL